jgi:hypothetical protein
LKEIRIPQPSKRDGVFLSHHEFKIIPMDAETKVYDMQMAAMVMQEWTATDSFAELAQPILFSSKLIC